MPGSWSKTAKAARGRVAGSEKKAVYAGEIRARGEPALGSRQRMEARAKVWTLKWKGDPTTFSIVKALWKRTQNLAEETRMKLVAVDFLQRLISALPDKIPGVDQTSKRHFTWLPPAGLQGQADLISAVEENVCWPRQVFGRASHLAGRGARIPIGRLAYLPG